MNNGKASKVARTLWFFPVALAAMVVLPSVVLAQALPPLPFTPSVGGAIANVVLSSWQIPTFIAALAYLFALLMAVLGIVKIKDHVISPTQVPLSDGIKRLVVCGCLASLPMIIEATVNTLTAGNHFSLAGFALNLGIGTNTAPGTGPDGLDNMMMNMVGNVFIPMGVLVGFFCYLAGIVLIIIGISRLLKTSQEGPRGPSGSGTIITFLVGGLLLSVDEILAYFGQSLFANALNPLSFVPGYLSVYANLGFSTGDADADQRILNVVSTCLVFMIMIGWVSFVRGWFIIRDVAEGDRQASLMAGMTHIFGGAIAVNLGSLINFVQNTFGITGFGITFT